VGSQLRRGIRCSFVAQPGSRRGRLALDGSSGFIRPRVRFAEFLWRPEPVLLQRAGAALRRASFKIVLRLRRGAPLLLAAFARLLRSVAVLFAAVALLLCPVPELLRTALLGRKLSRLIARQLLPRRGQPRRASLTHPFSRAVAPAQ